VIDGALDSSINAFYLAKEGAQAPYLDKQRARTHAALKWLDERAPFHTSALGSEFGLEEIALLSALDWMTFRNAYDVTQVPRLAAFTARFSARPSVAETVPH
jgi:glutathione S-transferase